MTESGCQQCGENTYSGDGAESCTSCPEGKISVAGSMSEADCSYGKEQSYANFTFIFIGLLLAIASII